jgi:hypothetical protein
LLRDAVVALNYAYYAPPGAQMLYANPVFVRSHDFVGVSGISQSWRATEVFGSGWPSNGGGRKEYLNNTALHMMITLMELEMVDLAAHQRSNKIKINTINI